MIATWQGSRWYVHDGESGEFLFRCTREPLEECGRAGRMDDIVAYWVPRVRWNHRDDRRPLIAALRGYGAWSTEELGDADIDTLRARILWITACDFRERHLQ